MVTANALPEFFTAGLQCWLSSNLQNTASFNGYAWNFVFNLALYFLWLMRNEFFFQRTTPSLELMHQHFWLFFLHIQVPASLLDNVLPLLSK